jgi:large subunit ribosomal protein L10
MKRSDKEQLVAELKDKLEGAEGVFYTDFTGLNVKRMTELRRRFRKAGVEYVVIKNTLALRAVNEAGLVGQKLKGPTGVVVAKDPITAAKLLTDFAKENDQKPSVKGGIYEGAVIDEKLVKKLASLPTRNEALSILVGTFNSVLMMFALALDAKKSQMDSGSSSTSNGNEGSEIPQASA